MALVPVTKLDKKNKVMFKKIDDEDDIISTNCDVIIIFPIINKLRCHYHFSWPIWSNPEARIRTHDLKNLHFH